MMYRAGGREIATPSSRREISIVPHTAGPYYEKNNRVIKISLAPSIGFLDCEQSYLKFRLRARGKGAEQTVDLTKEARLDKSAMSWCKKFTVYSSTGGKLEEIDNYNLLSNLLHSATGGPSYMESIGATIDNFGDKASRNAKFSSQEGSVYCSGLDCSGIFNGDTKILPIPFLQGAMELHFELAPFKECCIGTGYTPAGGTQREPEYELVNVEYIASVLSMGEQYSQKLSEQIRTQGADMSFVTYRSHQQPILTNTVDLPISQNSASVRGVYTVMRSTEVANSAEHDSLSTMKSSNLLSAQWDLGGHLTPQLGIQLKNDGHKHMYSHTLQSWNQFRNHAVGSTITEKNFASTDTKDTPRGLYGSGYQAQPIRRVYGTFVANGPKFAVSSDDISNEFTATANQAIDGVAAALNGTNGATAVKGVPTLHFVPDDPTQISSIPMGQRCKFGVSAAIHGETTANTDHVFSKSDDGALGDVSGATSMGLDRFYLHEVTSKPQGYEHDNIKTRDAVLYAGAPTAIAWGYTTPTAMTPASKHVAGLAIPFCDGQNNPVFSKQACVHGRAWIDCLPDDSSFYIGCNFETHGSTLPDSVSGADLTNLTPLMLKLEFQQESESNIYEARKDTDIVNTFVCIDAVLRLANDGTLISST